MFSTEIDSVISDLAYSPIVERERKKAEKTKKFTEKQAKTTSNSTASKSKGKPTKKESAKDVPLPEYIEETPPGEKKSMLGEKLCRKYER